MTPQAIADRNALAARMRNSAAQNNSGVWINPQYNPGRNDNGYTRYDYTQRGSGLEHSKTFADGARTFESYNKLQQNQPGWGHAENARKNLTAMGVSVASASDEQKFDAMDLSMRSAQFKNQRPKRKFSLGKLIMQVAPAIAGSLLLPGVGTALGTTISAGAGGAIGGALAGGIRGGVKGAALGGLSGYGIGSGIGAGKSWLASRSLAASQPFHAGALGKGFASTSLYSPGSLAGTASSAGTGILPSTAFHPGALGLTGSNLSLGLTGANLGTTAGLPITSTAGGGFFNPNALGRTFNNYSLYSPASLGGSPAPTLLQRGLKTFDQLMDSGLLSGGNQAQARPGAGVGQRQQRLAAPGLGGGRRSANSLPIPTTGIREALAQQAAKRLQNNGGLTRLTPIQSGLLRL